MSHSLDGFTPSTIEYPETLEQLSSALGSEHKAGKSVIPHGGGTRIGIGNIPTAYDTAIDLSKFTGEIEHEPGDMTVVANAGVKIATLNDLLAKEGQRLPFEIRNPSQATVGGSVASNASGHRQSSTGGIRDWVIGMQIVLADGTVTKSGGRVVKNVQGYEMHRLNTGAFGTLGIVSQAAFKLLPLPPEQQTIIMWFGNRESAQDVGMSLVNGLFMPEATSLIAGSLANKTVTASGESAPTGDTWALLVRLGGGVRSIERQVNEVVGAGGANSATGYAVLSESAASAAWSALDDAETNAKLSVRMTSLPVATMSTAESIRSAVSSSAQSDVSTICDLGFGALTVLVADTEDSDQVDITNSITSEIEKHPASYVIEKCGLSVKQSRDVFSDVGSSIDLMKRIKNQYDPTNTLNPGRFAGKI
ncbi:FAD-binding oxidoreductase [Candidatus Lucifugimonas marina]|uniref:FAD-binding protein n=1 Tax=Candidatus Lucifugimonas marina TaxID=3038979 RepID=A0AAJ5ZLD4_9CHLR|nr:FAD-binding protein [SAR202 cluster bacterium JH702]MDG0868622.1 FAD-binding protein [SAR202 cluster bacterium JH639]WFG36818.1 FAD-binding protein [SAR202 cluster bacterium JH545]WFG40756.1 FAD-binding protein [SAR202 cluster bacterium JH1073]